MRANLVTLKSSADALLEEKRSHKGKRIDDGAAAAPSTAQGSAGITPPGNSMVPFADRRDVKLFQPPDKQ